MDALNNNHTENLRDVDVMISYLQDEMTVTEIGEVEKLMEEDELYRLSMEQLATSLVQSPVQTRSNVLTLQKSLPTILAAQKESFIAQLEAQGGHADNNPWMDKIKDTPFWQKYLLIAAIPLLILLAILPIIHKPKLAPHKNPVENLVPDGDLTTANTLITDCGELQGIGRAKEVTVYSALLENYAEENYQIASQQFELLTSGSSLSPECQSIINFYLAKSYMALNKQTAAKEKFAEVLKDGQASARVKNACHWYLANIYLSKKDQANAQTHLNALLQQDPTDTNMHLKALMDKNYLEDAGSYLDYIKNQKE